MARAPSKHTGKAKPPSAPLTPLSHPHVAAAIHYADDVVSGRIDACRLVRQACERFQLDMENANTAVFPYRLHRDKAERPCRFIELMPHTKGKWAAEKELIKLEPWQCFLVVNMFGWLRVGSGAKRWNDMDRRGTLENLIMRNPGIAPADLDTRRYRRVYIEVPRKNAKSTLAAAIGLYMLSADGEEGAEVYCGAGTEKQAWEVFGPARLMAERSPQLLAKFGIAVNARNINILSRGCKFEPIIGNPGDGASPSMSITDEYHEHDTSAQFDTMITGMGAREQAMAFVITTAGDNIRGPCYDMREMLVRVLSRVSTDEEFFGLVYTIDEGDKWDDPAILAKANPNFGVSVSEEFLQARQKEALTNLRARYRFQTKHLNKWIQASAGYFDMSAWNRCEDQSLRLEDLQGHRAWLGLDLASKVDIAALCVLVEVDEERLAAFEFSYLPEETIDKPENEHYREFRHRGEIIQTDGNITDYARIEEEIDRLADVLEIQDIAFDPHQATMLITRLTEKGLPCVEFRPMVLNFSEPMKMLDALIKQQQPGQKRLVHPGDRCMTWQIGNVTAQQDRKDNVYPRKEREENKIDGPVALISAIGRYMVSDTLGDTLTTGIIAW